MPEKSTPNSNPNESNPPVRVDHLGQPEPDFQELNPTDKSCRELTSVADIRQAVTKKGGQPK